VNRLHAGSAATGDGTHRQTVRTGLLLAQCAGAVALVVLSVMLTRSFVALVSFDLGWNPAGVLSLDVAPPAPPELLRPWSWYVDWSDRLIAQLEATPGIERAAVTTGVPLSPRFVPIAIATGRGRDEHDDTRRAGVIHHVTDGYFDTMGLSVLRGRTFVHMDRASQAELTYQEPREPGVVIVSRTTARTLWPDQEAVGQALWLPDLGDAPWREVVGIVEDLQFHTVGEEPALHLFVPWTQSPTGNPLLMVKGTTSGAPIASIVRRIVEAVEPGTGIDQIVWLDDLVARATAQPRFTARTVAAFGALALVLAAVGIYGTLSYMVGARTREIAIRLSLGASRRTILPDVLRRALVPVVAGGSIGIALAAALARAFEALLFGVEPLDVGSCAAGATLMLLTALAAALAPARRAMNVDPAVTLRAE
jgi:putative ABC transport system permease protein